jgi:hypothetical protein
LSPGRGFERFVVFRVGEFIISAAIAVPYVNEADQQAGGLSDFELGIEPLRERRVVDHISSAAGIAGAAFWNYKGFLVELRKSDQTEEGLAVTATAVEGPFVGRGIGPVMGAVDGISDELRDGESR